MQRIVKNLFIGTVACVAAIATPSGAKADGETYNRTLKATAWVLAKTGGATSSGTGVLVDAEKKLLITNFHVVGDARAAVIFFPDMKKGKAIGERKHYLTNITKLGVRGRVLGIDRKRDLALIELDRVPAGAEAIELAEDSVGTAEEVQSIGNSGSSEALWVHTSGDVRALYQKQFRTGAGEHDFMVVETQSPINPGDSGGPVVNKQGQLVAICQSLAPKARLITYCVDISEVKTFLASDWKRAPLPITDILDKAELTFTKTQNADILEVSIEQDSDDKNKTKTSQTVFVASDVEYYEQADVRKVWALAATLKEAPELDTTLRLLQESARTKMGGWSIEKADNGDYLVIFVCKVDATASPRALKSTMEYVAQLATRAKKGLTPTQTTKDPTEILSSWLSE